MDVDVYLSFNVKARGGEWVVFMDGVRFCRQGKERMFGHHEAFEHSYMSFRRMHAYYVWEAQV